MIRLAAPPLLVVFAAMSLLVVGGCSRDRSEHGAPPLRVFGHAGSGPLGFNYPRAAAIAPDGALYVVDKGGRIQAFSQDGVFLRDWKMPATDAGKPTGLGASPDGRIFAADTHYSRVIIFSPAGTIQRMFGTYGDGPGQLRLPTDVAVAADGTIYVSEYGGHDRISRFTPDLEFIDDLVPPESAGAFRRPQALVIDRDGSLWVADSCNHRICHFAADGRWLGAFGHLGDDPGELRFPYGIDLLSDGSLVVCEYGNNRVQRFTPDGRSLGTWGSAGRAPGQLAYPWTLVVGHDDHVFVVDSGNNRVQVIDGGKKAAWAHTH